MQNSQAAARHPHPDAILAGGGIIGLALALELRRRGLSVTVVERGQAMSSASWAAGGMLAVDDPQNPPALMPLCRLSRTLYPEFLERVESLSVQRVPLRTQQALQYVDARISHGLRMATREEMALLAPGLHSGDLQFALLEEGSLDPNDLRTALPAAVLAAGGNILEETAVLGVKAGASGVRVQTASGVLSAGIFVNCCGAWAGEAALGGLPIAPVKGQMLNLHCAPERLRGVVRAPGVYLIPRGEGRVTIGSTIEDAGFDETVREASIAALAERARALVPELQPLPQAEHWAGLRPGTPDALPVLGAAAMEHGWHATGHYRDGILLAPATARLMAQMILGETPEIPVGDFSPQRFAAAREGFRAAS